MTVFRARMKYGSLLLVFAGAAVALGVWPAHQNVRELEEGLEQLEHQAEQLGAYSAHVQEARSKLDAVRERRFRELKPIPDHADLPGLVTSITAASAELALNGSDVNGGSHSSAGRDLNLSLVVETTGSFDAVFELIQRIESLPRLICIDEVMVREPASGSKRLNAPRPESGEQVQATVSLKAYYENSRSLASAEEAKGGGANP